MTGRPSKYTRDVHARIVRALRAGAFKAHAALYAGIAPRTLAEWLAWGRDGREPYASLAHDVERAQARLAEKLRGIVLSAAEGGASGEWRAAAWLLERRFPKLYGACAQPDETEAPSANGVHSPWLARDGVN